MLINPEQGSYYEVDSDGISRAANALASALESYPNSATLCWDATVVGLIDRAQNADATPWALREAVRQRNILSTQAATAANVYGLVGLLKDALDQQSVEDLKTTLELDQTPHIDKKLTNMQRLFAKQMLELPTTTTERLEK